MSRTYDTSFQFEDFTRRERHGRPWTTGELSHLKHWFMQGHTLEDICVGLKRPAKGVVPKLESLGLIQYGGDDNEYLICNCEIETIKEPTMNTNAPIIEVKTVTTVYISGVDATKLSDLAIFTKIAELESTVRQWESIICKPAKLLKLIEATKIDILRLSDFVDARV